MSKVTTVYYGFVISKNKCVKKKELDDLVAPGKNLLSCGSFQFGSQTLTQERRK
jgi:hypothetical protein